MTNFTPELVEKAKAAASAEQLLEIAKAAGVEMTPAEAATYFAQLNPKSGELDDDDLDAVSGGACEGYEATKERYDRAIIVTSGQTCKKCGGNKGHFWKNAYTGIDWVKCDTCGEHIAHDDGSITYEYIG